MDRFLGDLSYCLHLVTGFNAVEEDHGRRLSAMGSVRALVVVEGDPLADTYLGLRAGLPGVQVDAFIFQGPPETLDEDVVEAGRA